MSVEFLGGRWWITTACPPDAHPTGQPCSACWPDSHNHPPPTCTCETSPPEFGGPILDRDCPIHDDPEETSVTAPQTMTMTEEEFRGHIERAVGQGVASAMTLIRDFADQILAKHPPEAGVVEATLADVKPLRVVPKETP